MNPDEPPTTPPPPRVLVVLPSWLGDTVMATPTLRLLRGALPRSTIVGLARAGIDELLAGDDLLDDVILADRTAVLGPAKVAGRLTKFRFDAALLLPNSFSSAITVRLAGIPIRVGYDRDGRGALLTHKLQAPRRAPPHDGWAPISAVEYYLAAGRACLSALGAPTPGSLIAAPKLELGITESQDRQAREILAAAGVPEGQPFALLNPGGNNPAKRWPVERFAAVAHHLIAQHGMMAVINGSPTEAELVALIRDVIVLDNPADAPRVACLPELGGTIGSLKGIVKRCRLMVTNDTGPRHVAAAFGRPCVTLFGPTDPRWTALPEADVDAGNARRVPREVILVADPTLPTEEIADDHPRRCRIELIETRAVIEAVDGVMSQSPGFG
ncbi:MAG: glycosyltransferase family 9 protein [Phycisphaerales bacterium]